MDYVNLGGTGLRVSRVCLGMMSFGKHAEREWALDEAGAEPIVRRAVEGGITFFDTADVYNGGESEVLTGRFAQERDCAVLLVEQHVDLALEVADRGYVLSHGEIALRADAARLRADRQLLIASYLGEQGQASAAAEPATRVDKGGEP